MKKIQLSIPEPCHEKWQAMSPTQQGRFCNACAKEVIDFSNMSDSDVLNYFIKKKKEDNVCGRVYADQLDRNIYAAAQKKKYWQWQYILTALLFFMKPAKTKAQGAMVYLAADTTYSITQEKDKNRLEKKIKVKGVVKDEEGNPVPYASIKVKDDVTGVSADENGKFSIKIKKGQSLSVSATDYETRTITATTKEEKEIVLTKTNALMKEVVISSVTDTRIRCFTAGGIMVKGEMIKRVTVADTIRSWFITEKPAIKIYPNPVLKASSFTINMKLKQPGAYSLQINDAAGRLITEQKINAAGKEWNEQVAVGSTWSAGMYYVKILNERKTIVTTANLVVQ